MTHRITLSPGGIALVEPCPSLGLVTVSASFRTGSTLDPRGKEGIARFLARMLRRGAGGKSAQEVEECIDRMGAELSVDVGPSSISVHGQVIARNAAAFCDVLATLLSEPTFATDEVERLARETVAELVEAQDSDPVLGGIAFRRALFGDHPYGRGTSGTRATVETFCRDDVTAAYARHLHRDGLVLGFSGAIDPAAAEQLGARIANALPDGRLAPSELSEPTAPEGRKLVFVDKPDRTQTQIIIGSLGTSAHDEDHIALVAATAVLGGTFTSRMMREIRSKRGWSYGTSARLSVERRRHAFAMSAAPGTADCAPCVALQLSLLEDFVASGITDRELGFIKNYLVRSHAFEIDTAAKRLGQALETELLHLPADYHTTYLERVRSVTRADTQDAITRRLTKDNLVIVVVGTASDTWDAVQSSIPRLASATVTPFDALT